ncbi:FKBP-type peptidyl-prolyl cis-trans isomerase [Verminephrobacter aporrectodeae]|uniref:FKBP-type peptidyl-prolyl cis-trans isomerase n=1 Tax=Verminephrobacter aporrectodeae TaxID=1110389 RepID=UPI002243B820|nr:peptidylprolyl isomerase [Verminephrobacter aporrectodeae]MCW8174904.1 peptidylprolyl isomerase [Verminephrobacter aporrectodeae subsp. tuberculatae]MCW8198604.1 peptidylprolyl isomerase [Verminephrobacter aporrectodeae subsp. tuberculatae]MCW8202924.1 peptidylprolyl isomerase [Verminephrobacter aporrectodeae subsp. tuberculatae]MCW8206705.1 peptidylprolyl isomerase [Verminephrobacter aporrectodeae subsp. tuberculatae]
MEITRQCVVALTWTLKDSLGEVLDLLEEPVEFLVGGDDLLPRIEEALQGRSAGATLALQLEPEDAFGDFDEQLLFLAPRALLPADVEEGMALDGMALPEACSPDAPRHAVYTVAGVYPEHVLLDGNHPLAGMGLRLQLTVQAVRAASAQEIGCGSAGTGFFRVQPGGSLRH